MRDLRAATRSELLIGVYRRRLWRMILQIRFVLAFVVAAWALTVGAGRHDHALDTEILVGVGLLVTWNTVTTLWSSYLWEELHLRPSLAMFELAVGVALLCLGGGLHPVFVGYAGMTMAIPAFFLGQRAIAAGWFVLVSTFPIAYLLYRALGADPELRTVGAASNLFSNVASYSGVAALIASFVYVLRKLDGLSAVERQVLPRPEVARIGRERARLRDLSELSREVRAQLDEITSQLSCLATRRPTLRQEIETSIAVLQDAQTRNREMPATLGQLLDEAERELHMRGIDRFTQTESRVCWVPEELAPGRLFLEGRRAEALRTLLYEAARNMRKYGRPPFEITVVVDVPEYEFAPGAEYRVSIALRNEVNRLRPPRDRGTGSSVMDEAQRELRADSFSNRANGRLWIVEVSFRQPAVVELQEY